jgi:hypothetical protein
MQRNDQRKGRKELKLENQKQARRTKFSLHGWVFPSRSLGPLR